MTGNGPSLHLQFRHLIDNGELFWQEENYGCSILEELKLYELLSRKCTAMPFSNIPRVAMELPMITSQKVSQVTQKICYCI